MGTSVTMSFDVEEAIENVKRMQEKIEEISQCVDNAKAAVESATEKNNLQTMLDIAGGLGIFKPQIDKFRDVPDTMIEDLRKWQNTYEEKIDVAGAGARALSLD